MKKHQVTIDELRELVVDNFAGGGGASTGIALAIGRSVDIAINHDPAAIAMHKANHPETKHLCESVWEVDPRKVTRGVPVGLAWFSPDCFPAGTVVLTERGYRPIEEIAVGDVVLTHRLRWRRVTEVSKTRRPLVSIKGHGHPGLAVSPEHPFLVRTRSYHWNNDSRRDVSSLSDPQWIPVSALTGGDYRYSYEDGRRTIKDGGHYWGTPSRFEPLPIPPVGGRGMPIDERLMWLAGRYLADGWTRLTDDRAELVITCGKHEVEGLRTALDRWPREGSRSASGELAWHERETRTAYQFASDNRGFVEWLRTEFGHGAKDKRIPGWALGMSDNLRHSLLSGYVSGDGSLTNFGGNPLVQCTTISKSIAFGLRALAGSLGYSPSVYHNANPNRIIEGRTVNANPSWSIRWRTTIDDGRHQTVRGDGIEWGAIKEISPISPEADVYNIGVDEDESYIAEGVIVHNCTHFSKAKGGKPVSKKIRGLAWVAVRWAAQVKPRVIMLENVEEFTTWGPLIKGADGNMYPDPERKSQTFQAFVHALERQGYRVEWKELRACDYGAPTIRKRFFLVARCDGRPIVWPQHTHGDPKSAAVKAGKLLPWRTAAEIIDWSLPCPSIFERKRPLKENTLRRIARGIQRFIIDNPNPFVIRLNYPSSSQRERMMDEPVQTMTAKNDLALVNPFVIPVTHQGGPARVVSLGVPFPTVTAAHRGEHALIVPVVDRQFGRSVGHGANEPLGTVTAGGSGKSNLVAAFLAQYHSETAGHDARGQTLDRPILTVDSSNRYGLVAAHLAKHYGGGYTGPGNDPGEPLSTVTAVDHNALVTSHLIKLRGTCADGQPVTEPMPTVTAGGLHVGEVRAFLLKYFSTAIGQECSDPLHTVTAKHRFGLVTVEGQDYQIVDIGMRMLEPRELFAAQGFPADYIIDMDLDGKRYSKAAQVARCGNAVPPPFARALVEANLPEVCIRRSA